MGFASRTAILAATLGFFALPAAAQDIQPPIWVIEDADSTVYMVGTVHMMREGVDWQSTAIADALDEAEVLWLEIPDLTPPDNLDALIMTLAIAPDRPLSSLLDADELAALEAILDVHGIPLDAFDTLRPWFAYLQITGLLLIETGFDPDMGMDVQLKAQADAMGTPVFGFETFEEQFEMLAGMSEEVQLEVLRQTIIEYDQEIEEIALQLESWIGGDLTALEEGNVEIAEEMPEFYEALFGNRNAGFADGIEAILEGEGVSMVAVGLGHFVGPDSIPALLEERGYTVERR